MSFMNEPPGFDDERLREAAGSSPEQLANLEAAAARRRRRWHCRLARLLRRRLGDGAVDG
jgi:hypothetical protein